MSYSCEDVGAASHSRNPNREARSRPETGSPGNLESMRSRLLLVNDLLRNWHFFSSFFLFYVPLTRERPPPREISPARARARARVARAFASLRVKRRAPRTSADTAAAARPALLFTCENVGAVRAKERFGPSPRTPGGEVRRWVRRPLRMLANEGAAGGGGRVWPLSRVPRRRERRNIAGRATHGGREGGGDEGKAWWEGGSGNGGSGREFARGAEKSRTCGLYPRMIPRLSRAEFNVLSGSAPESRGRQAGRRAATRPLRHTYTHTYTHTHIHTEAHIHTYVRAVHGRTRFREIAHGRPLAPPLRTPRGYTGCPAPTRRLLSHSAEGTRKGFVEKQEGHAGWFVSRPGRLPDSCPS